MIRTYERVGGKINQNHWSAAFYAVMGGWINWLVYNLQRKERVLGVEQAKLALDTVKRLSKFAEDASKPRSGLFHFHRLTCISGFYGHASNRTIP